MSAAEISLGCRWCSAYFTGLDRHKAYRRHLDEEHPIDPRAASTTAETHPPEVSDPPEVTAVSEEREVAEGTAASAPALTCPECGRIGFSGIQGLNGHRAKAHGVAGTRRPTKKGPKAPKPPKAAAMMKPPITKTVADPQPAPPHNHSQASSIDLPTDVMHDICRLLLGHAISAERRLEILGVLLP